MATVGKRNEERAETKKQGSWSFDVPEGHSPTEEMGEASGRDALGTSDIEHQSKPLGQPPTSTLVQP